MSFSSAIRSKITTAVHEKGHWAATRSGKMCRVSLDRTRPPGAQFAWGICLSHRWVNGVAPTVFSALAAIERARFG